MPRPLGSLQRSLQALTVGVVQGQQAREKQLAPTALGEMTQHNQLPIQGNVGEKPMSFITPVSWPYPFVYAPVQRDSDFTNPHFNYGIEYQGGGVPMLGAAVPTEHAIIVLGVAGWLTDDDGYSTGAMIAITAWIPGAKKKRQFSALAHLTFWGYGAPDDDDGLTEDASG